jgi:hypothetical protein
MFWVAVAALVLSGVGAVEAERQVVNLASSAIAEFEPADSLLGKFYTLRMDVPEGITSRKLTKAILELTADVSTVNRTDYINETPVFEIYLLNGTFNGTLDPEKIEKSSPMRRVVWVGRDRTIRIDVTDAVKSCLADPASNHGLIMGSLTNVRDGVFDINKSSAASAKITYFYTER